jgi:hypothetical protein
VPFYNILAFFDEKPIETIWARSMVVWEGSDDMVNFILAKFSPQYYAHEGWIPNHRICWWEKVYLPP